MAGFAVLAGAGLEEHAKGVGIAEDAAFEPRGDGFANDAFGGFAAFAGTVADQTVVGFDADEHRIPLDDLAVAAVIGEFNGLRKDVGEQEAANGSYLHEVPAYPQKKAGRHAGTRL